MHKFTITTSDDVGKLIDDERERLRAASPGTSVSMADAVRSLIVKGAKERGKQ